MKESRIYRIIDANLNRLQEGLRVCEEVTRFILDDKRLTHQFKDTRHRTLNLTLDLVSKTRLIKSRDILKDAGKKTHPLELKRKDFADIFFANIQRAKESIRALEEFSKLIDKDCSLKFKSLRYRLYQTEKKAGERFQALCNPR